MKSTNLEAPYNIIFFIHLLLHFLLTQICSSAMFSYTLNPYSLLSNRPSFAHIQKSRQNYIIYFNVDFFLERRHTNKRFLTHHKFIFMHSLHRVNNLMHNGKVLPVHPFTGFMSTQQILIKFSTDKFTFDLYKFCITPE